MANHHANESASPGEIARVAELIGRAPSGDFSVVVRDRSGDPVVIRNAPFLHDGTPMPTRYWLVGKEIQEAVGRLESSGGVRRIEAHFDPNIISTTHERYASERDGLINSDYQGPRPSGGVGGTRRGLKCLHAHVAAYLAGTGDPVGRYVVQQIREQITGAVGAIDCGTNSTRLLVLDSNGEVLERRMVITRLGEGVDQTGHLLPAAIERTIAALRAYREILDRHGVVSARATATSAARDALNREELFSSAREVLGFELELLHGVEEGTLSYLGATAGLDHHVGAYLVVDIGGGSTEFAAGSSDNEGSISSVASLDIGCVRLTERFFQGDPPSQEQITAARSVVTKMIAELRIAQPSLSSPHSLVGVAGTVATLATRSLGLSEYEGSKTHHVKITKAFVDDEFDLLSSMSADRRRALPGIETARADVIVGGLLIVQQVFDRFGFDEMIYSESDILDGLASSQLAR